MATKVKLIADSIITTDQLDTASLDAHFTGGTGVTYSGGTISIGQAVHSTDSPTFADLTITGNLNITGDINSYNVTDLDVTDKTITLGAGQIESNSGGSGIIVDGSNASILWDETNTEWDFNNSINVTGTLTASGGSSNNDSTANILTLNASEHARLVVDTSSTGGHRATLALKSNGNETQLTTTGNASFLNVASGNLTVDVAGDIILDGNVGIGYTVPENALSVQGVISSGNSAGVAIGGTPADANTAELGPGYLNLARDDTADAKQILFGKNGSVHSYLETTTSGLNIGGANVGIGTNSPNAKLELNVASGDGLLIKSADVSTIKMKGSGGVIDWGFAATYQAAGDFGIYASNSAGGDPITAGTAKMYFTSAGNVGLNTSSLVSTATLTLGGASRIAPVSGNGLLFAAGGSDRMFLNTSGNLSIGNTNGNSTLDLTKTSDTGERAIRIENSSARLYMGVEGSSGNRFSGSSVNNGFIGTTTDDGLEFGTANVVRAVITNAGDVGIGITQPEAKLHVDDNTVVFGNSSSGYATINFHSATTNSARYASIRKNYDSPYDMRIRGSNSSSEVPIIFETSNSQEAIQIDNEGLHFQRVDGQLITSKESLTIKIDEDNNTASRVFSVNHGNGKQLFLCYDDYRTEVGTLQYSSTRSYGATSSGSSFSGSAGDWVDVAVVPYGREIATIKLWWDGLAAPGTAHHGNMEFKIASHYGTSYYYGWDSSINLVSSTAHNSFYISEARIITPNGAGATGHFQVKLGVAVSSGTFRAYVTERDEGCGIYPMTPAVNNSRSGTTIASLKMGTDRGLTNNRLSLATSRDMHIGGGLTILSQHSFNAYSPAVTTTNNVVVFGNARHNVGGRYSTSTGRFTAGTSGKYLFTFDVLMKPTNTGQYGRLLFRVNNVGSTMEQYGDNLTYQADQPSYFGLGLTAVISLGVGDFVEVLNAGQWETYGTQYGHFGGHLLG